MSALSRSDEIWARAEALKRRRNYPRAAERFARFGVPAEPLEAERLATIEARAGVFPADNPRRAQVTHDALGDAVAELGDGARLAVLWGRISAPGPDNKEFEALVDRDALAGAVRDPAFVQAIPLLRLADPDGGDALEYVLFKDEHDAAKDWIEIRRPGPVQQEDYA